MLRGSHTGSLLCTQQFRDSLLKRRREKKNYHPLPPLVPSFDVLPLLSLAVVSVFMQLVMKTMSY